ncbi:uncharacterized protein ISCGN_009485 [Ixodes scapularis]
MSAYLRYRRLCQRDAMPGHRRQRHCFAPGRKTGYQWTKGEQPSIFAVPKDENRRKQWERNLHRMDKALDYTCSVCELHFEPSCIMRDFVHVIAGKEVRIPRGKPELLPDAVPTLLQNTPSYMSKKVPLQKPPRKRKNASVCPVEEKRAPSHDFVIDLEVSGPSTDTDECAGKGEHQHLGCFVTKAFSNYKKAMDAFKSHAASSYHGSLLCILATLPVSTSTPKRTFSTLRRLKSCLRNHIKQDRLTGLALLSVHREIQVDPEEVLTDFCKLPRRKNFVV